MKVAAMISAGKKARSFRLLANTLSVVALLIVVMPAHAQKVRASYGGFNTSSNIPPWVAYDAGIFKRNGLDVDLIFASSNLMMPAVMNKDLLLADSNAFGLINIALGGADLIMVAARSLKMEGVIFVTGPIKRVADLKGKSLGITRQGSLTDFEARIMLRAHGLEPTRDVTMVQLVSTDAVRLGLERGIVQAGILSGTEVFLAHKAGMRKIEATAELSDVEFNRSAYLVRRSSLTQERPQLKSYLRSLIEAYDLAKKEPARAYKAMQRFTGIKDTESLALTYKACMEQFCQRVPYVSLKGMDYGAQFLKETRPEVRARVDSMDLNKLFDNSILKEAQQELGGGS
jgi:NitT/TauT family transport system substrate-binding protein